MKKSFAITVILAWAMGGFAQILHYDFQAVCETGQTLYYLITNEEEHTVMLTYPYSEENEWFMGNYYEGHPEPEGEIILPSIVAYNDIQYSVTAIDANAFNACNLAGALAVPEGVVSIGAMAFLSCDFTSVTIPRSVEVIATLEYGYGSPFAYCSSLESITVDVENPSFYSESNALIKREGKVLVQGCKTTTIPDDVETIGCSAFQGAGDGGNLVIPNSVTTINSHAFYECKFSGSITLSDSLRYIGGDAFCYSHFSGPLTLPDSVIEIGGGAFAHCGLSGNLILPQSLSTINGRAFSSGGFSGSLIIPNTVTYIGINAFETTNFSELVLGNSVETIDLGAFNNCFSNTHLTGVLRLPASLTKIRDNAFAYTDFNEIYSPNPMPPTLEGNPFDYCDRNIPIHIPLGCTEIYRNTPGWDYFSNFIENMENAFPEVPYGFLYQPDSAVIELDPNSSMGSEYGDFQARFEYYPNGLLYIQDAFSINYPYDDEGDDYGHTDWFVYDSDLHVIEQHDSYYDIYLGLASYLNRYVYDDGLLIAFTIYYNDHHSINDPLILEDSISYTYDGLRRLQTEERFVSTTSIKNYEYLENEVIITTDGYTNGTSGDWLTLSREIRTFNEDSLLVSSQTEKYNDSTILITYGYDALGHRTSILTQKRNNGVWENQKLVQYHFNPNGRLTLAEIKLWHDDAFVDAHRAVYELNELGYPATVTFEKWDGDTWGYGIWQSDFYLYDEGHLQQQNDMLYSYRNSIHKIELSYIATNNPREPLLPDNSEWFYEILNDDGSITYQHLEYMADTTIGTQRPKIIVRSNTQYDKNFDTEVTHEYVYEANGIVYWWNKDLEEFTTLYDLNANMGDEWTIKVGYDSLVMLVDGVENIEYNGQNYRVLHVSDADNLFSGNIVCGVGHLTSFFPERLMRHAADYTVNGMRCYWVDGSLVFKYDDEDCDAVYDKIHFGIEEDGSSTPSTDSGALVVYPNPANNMLFVEMRHGTSLPDSTYCITNLMGQTIISGILNIRLPQCDSPTTVDISSLPAGMYFISMGGQTVKFVVKK